MSVNYGNVAREGLHNTHRRGVAISEFNTAFFLYSHIAEVIRTRLREEGSRYRSFFQTLLTVPREEGYRALYRGLTTHLVRQIPNTAIMMCTYEVVVYLLGR